MITRENDPRRIQYAHAIVVCWINPVIVQENVSPYRYQDKQVLYSDKIKTVVYENGNRVEYTNQFCGPYHNVKYSQAGITKFETFARTLPGARKVNYYNAGIKRKEGNNFIESKML
jgi:hypothetical protein